MKRRLQNKVAESSVTLPTACVVATLLWWMPQGAYSTDYLLGWITCAVTTYILIETNAVNALLRIRSRMISSLYLLLMAACGFLHPLQTGSIIQCCMSLSFFCLLRTADKPRPEVDTMHTHLLLSLSSLLWAPILWLNIIMFWNQAVYLRVLTWKSLGAAVIGIIIPYIFWASAAFLMADMNPFIIHATDIIEPFTRQQQWQWVIHDIQTLNWHTFWQVFPIELLQHLRLHLAESVAMCLIMLMSFTGFIHYVRKSYDDKIRVRICHYTYMSMQLILTVWIIIQPSYFYHLFPLLLLTTIPTMAHFIALTHTWMTNAWVVLLAMGLIAVGFVNMI